MEKELKKWISIYSNIDADDGTSYEITKRYCNKKKIVNAENFYINSETSVLLTTGEIECESISSKCVKACCFGSPLDRLC